MGEKFTKIRRTSGTRYLWIINKAFFSAVMRYPREFWLQRSTLPTKSGMESTKKAPWSRKRKLKAKMERMHEAKLAKSDTSTSPSTAITLPDPTTCGSQSESYETPYSFLQGTTGVHGPEMSLGDARRVTSRSCHHANEWRRFKWKRWQQWEL